MKKLLYITILAILISCTNEEPKDYVTLKGQLTPGITNIKIQGQNFLKELEVDELGNFSDTMKVSDGIHALITDKERMILFLKNGYDLTLSLKGETLADGVEFEGQGAPTNTFLENQRTFSISDFGNPKTYFSLEKEDFEVKVQEAKDKLASFRTNIQEIDTLLVQMVSQNDEMFFSYINKNYESSHELYVKFARGKKSPTFSNYENFKGGTTSLTDLKGKYVYIDVWATWCAPCKAEIPYLKEIEEAYADKNIAFVSISVDRKDAYDTWRKMVEDKDLQGIQLFADNNFESDFIQEYGINAIPRFILIDPDGNIVDADAERPSNPKLKEIFTELGI